MRIASARLITSSGGVVIDGAGVNRVDLPHAFSGGPEQWGDDVLGDEQGVADGDVFVGLGVSPQECAAVGRGHLGHRVPQVIQNLYEVQVHGS